MRYAIVLAAGIAASALAVPAQAQHGHGAHPSPAKAAKDTAKATAKHEGHGKAAGAVTKDAAGTHKGHGAAGGGSMEHSSGWTELDAYHMVMMQVWHPAKEKGDLAPIRAKAAELAASAEVVAAAAVPAACDTPANRADVANVRAESKALAAMVAGNAPDAAVLEALRALHDRFETVNRGCVAK